MNPISHLVLSLYVLSAGVTLQSALVSRAGHRSQLFLPFALLSLCVTMDLLSTAWVYASKDVAEAALAFKFQAAAISLWQLPFYFFVTRLTGKTPRPAFYVPLLLVLGGMFAINWAMPYGLRFSSLERLSDLALPWGEALARFGGTQSMTFKVFRVISLSMFVWALVRAVGLYRAGERRTAIYLSASVVLILLAALCGAMIDLLKLQRRQLVDQQAVGQCHCRLRGQRLCHFAGGGAEGGHFTCLAVLGIDQLQDTDGVQLVVAQGHGQKGLRAVAELLVAGTGAREVKVLGLVGIGNVDGLPCMHRV